VSFTDTPRLPVLLVPGPNSETRIAGKTALST